MRIAVFSTPRTCSTLMCSVLSSRFNLHNYNEKFYTLSMKESKKLHILNLEDNYVIKILSRYEGFENLETFDWKMFDYVFITQRQNLVDQMASLYKLQNKNQTHIDFLNSRSIEMYTNQKNWLPLFLKEKQKILATHKNAYVIEYEGLQNNPVEYLNSVTNLGFTEEHITFEHKSINSNYQTMFDNYNELQQLVDSWNLL